MYEITDKDKGCKRRRLQVQHWMDKNGLGKYNGREGLAAAGIGRDIGCSRHVNMQRIIDDNKMLEGKRRKNKRTNDH